MVQKYNTKEIIVQIIAWKNANSHNYSCLLFRFVYEKEIE